MKKGRATRRSSLGQRAASYVSKWRNKKVIIGGILGAAIVTPVLAVWAFSYGPMASVQPELGSVSGPATTVVDASASGGSSVRFNEAGVPPTCTASAGQPDGADAWGGCWPGPTTTGVPSGTSLTPYTGPCTITTNGTVIDAKTITCRLVVDAQNVTITRSRFVLPDGTQPSLRVNGSAVVEDSEFDGNRVNGAEVSGAGTTVSGSNYTLRRINMFNIYEGIRISGNVTIEDSYIHHLLRCTTATDNCHVDALQSTQGANIVVRHNVILAYNPDTDQPNNSSYIAKADQGNIDNVLIEKNYMNGGNYTLYVNNATYTTTNVTVKDNYFGRNHRFGPRSVHAGTTSEWSNNRYLDDNSLITL